MKKKRQLLLEIISILFALLFISPVIIVFVNSMKPVGDILRSPLALPGNFYIENYKYVFKNMNYLNALKNTMLIAVIVVTSTVILSALAGYKLVRTKTRISSIMSGVFLSAMLVPFQSIMIPISQIASFFHMKNTLWGYIIIVITHYLPMGIFMYHGFVKNVPISLEEAAKIDGCGNFKLFFLIVFPLMKPITASVTVLFTLWIWNDYLLPSIMLTENSMKTLTPMIFSFFSSYLNRWDYALTALTMSILPITLFYLLMQKQFISGIIDGAIKG